MHSANILGACLKANESILIILMPAAFVPMLPLKMISSMAYIPSSYHKIDPCSAATTKKNVVHCRLRFGGKFKLHYSATFLYIIFG